jgi:hypothetical protein
LVWQWFSFSELYRVFTQMIATGASGVSRTRNTIFIERLSVMDGTAGRQIMNGGNYMNCGSGAGPNTIGGGMNMNIAGTVIAIGTITIMTAIRADLVIV